MRHCTLEIQLSIEMIPASTASVDDAAAQRRKAFIDAAREAFFANGYAGTTMSSIASKVGGSKTTLWSYFPSKEELFEAVVDDIVALADAEALPAHGEAATARFAGSEG